MLNREDSRVAEAKAEAMAMLEEVKNKQSLADNNYHQLVMNPRSFASDIFDAETNVAYYDAQVNVWTKLTYNMNSCEEAKRIHDSPAIHNQQELVNQEQYYENDARVKLMAYHGVRDAFQTYSWMFCQGIS